MGFLDNLRGRPKGEQPSASSAPRGSSGRAHSNGYLELEELNNELRHPQCHQIFDKMYRSDGDVRQAIQLVTNPIVAGTWKVQAHGGQEAEERDEEIAEVVRWALFDIMRPTWIGHLIEFLPVLYRSGFVPGEIVWDLFEYEKDGPHKGKKLLLPKTIGLRLPRSVVRWPQKDGELLGIEQYTAAWNAGGAATTFDWTTGDPRPGQSGGGSSSGAQQVFIPSKDLVYYRIGGEGDNWEGQSLLRPAYKHWYLKDRIERLDAIAQEREAMGIPVVYIPPSADAEQIDEIERALQNLRTNDVGYFMIPGMKAGQGATEGTGWLFEILGYDASGSGRDPSQTLAYHTNKIAAAFIAEFMRLGHGETGARATAQVQADPFQMSVEALVTQLEQVANDKLVAPIVAYNFPDVKNPPRLTMSLVDSTSLSQLADFVLKLTQVGALLPDQELEDFLRARADLPPANPESVRQRQDDEEMIRRTIVGGNVQPTPAEKEGFGAPAAGDPFGSNDPKGRGVKHTNEGGIGKKKKGTPSGPGAKGQGAPRGKDPELEEGFTFAQLMGEGGGPTYRHDLHREPSGLEMQADLDMIEQTLDELPARMEAVLGDRVRLLAASCVDDDEMEPKDDDDIEDVLLEELSRMYRRGEDDVRCELGMPPLGDVELRSAHDEYGRLARRAKVASKALRSVMRHAHAVESLNSGNQASAQLAAETAGKRELRKIAGGHMTDAYQHGRHDRILAEGDSVYGVLYTAMLDRNTCPACEEADDAVVRALDDPVRLDRRPPNHNCHSTRGGANLCRCLEIPVPNPTERTTELDAALVPNEPGKTNWVEQAGGLPKYIADIAGDLITERGMDPSRAISVAVSRVKTWARGGGRVSPATQAKAAAAVAEWERLKARS